MAPCSDNSWLHLVPLFTPQPEKKGGRGNRYMMNRQHAGSAAAKRAHVHIVKSQPWVTFRMCFLNCLCLRMCMQMLGVDHLSVMYSMLYFWCVHLVAALLSRLAGAPEKAAFSLSLNSYKENSGEWRFLKQTRLLPSRMI